MARGALSEQIADFTSFDILLPKPASMLLMFVHAYESACCRERQTAFPQGWQRCTFTVAT
jgi:hypothetical protein